MKILVTGGSRGIGESLVRLLRQDEHEVFFTYCKSDEKAAQLERETGAKKIHYDQASEASIAELCRFIDKSALDGLVNGAAEKYARESILKTDPRDYVAYLLRGSEGVFALSKAFALSAKNRKSSGTIVNILSSVVFGIPPQKQASYIGLKYMLLGLSRAQAAEFASLGVRVNTVSPGMTRTDFISDLPERFIEVYEQSLPGGRLAKPEEVAAVIRFLLSPASSYLNGVNIPITGGQAC